ncbi:hypothetical protein AB0D04_01965 [Streptomyces sp. NPDC048483]|uniref:terpene synthase family protein n=1 Tax=Streptomyces sp. NPDC048483 TaxID=3154927 RepID=UPI003443DA71
MAADYGIPFEARRNPETDRLGPPHIAWMSRVGLLSAKNTAPYERMALWEAAAFAYPDARGEGLAKAVDAVGWMGVLDDWASATADLDAVQAVRDGCAAVTRGEAETDHPLVTAFGSLWERLKNGRSTTWCERFASDLDLWFEGASEELRQRAGGQVITPASYWTSRYTACGLEFFAHLAESATGFETADDYWNSEHRVLLIRAAVRMVVSVNDIQSADREERGGEPHNLVLILQREKSCSREEAVQAVIDGIGEAVDEYTALERALPDSCTALGTFLRDVTASTVVWGDSSGRYRAG